MSMTAPAMRDAAVGRGIPGAAARMVSAAYALMGISMEEGELMLRPDAFEEKAGLQLKSVSFKGKVFAMRESKGGGNGRGVDGMRTPPAGAPSPGPSP